MHFMVISSKEEYAERLVSRLYKEDLLSEVMRETPEGRTAVVGDPGDAHLLHRALEKSRPTTCATRALSTPPSRSCSVICAPDPQVKDSRDLLQPEPGTRPRHTRRVRRGSRGPDALAMPLAAGRRACAPRHSQVSDSMMGEKRHLGA